MKKLLLSLLVLLPVFATAQEEQGTPKELTKYERFISRTGRILKFYDINLSSLYMSDMVTLSSSIRVILDDDENKYYYRLEKEETSSAIARIAMIEYSDLVEINQALKKIKSEYEDDVKSNPDYLENKFVSEDGFQIGYYISKGTAKWYLKLEKYLKSVYTFRDTSDVIKLFSAVQKAIEEVKNKGEISEETAKDLTVTQKYGLFKK